MEGQMKTKKNHIKRPWFQPKNQSFIQSTSAPVEEHLQEYSSKQASRKPQQKQEGPVRSLHIKTDSQSVSGGVIGSLTAKGVGLSVTAQKGVRRRLTSNYHHDTERKPVIAVPGACRSIFRQRRSVLLACSKPSHRPLRQQNILPVFQTRRRTPHSSFNSHEVQTTSKPDKLLAQRITQPRVTIV